MKDYLNDWFNDPNWRRANKKKSEQAIRNDRWDREDLRRLLGSMAQFSSSREKLGRFADTGREAMSDTFWALLKGSPELLDEGEMKPEHLVNRRVVEELLKMDEAERLRQFSVNDDVQAALGCITLEPDLETLFDRVDQERAAAQQLQDLMQQLQDARDEKSDMDEMVERWKQQNQPQPGEGQPDDQQQGQDGQQGDQDGQEQEGDGEGKQEGQGGSGGPEHDLDDVVERWGEGQGEGKPQEPEVPQELQDQQQEANDKVEDLEQQVKDAMEKVEDALDRVGAETRQTMRNPLDKASQEASDFADLAHSWGVEPGQLRRMDAKERLDLAKRLNTPYFRRIADLFGPMQNIMWTEQKRRVEYAKEEVHDISIGNDLGRLLPQELINLRPGSPSRADFMRRYTEGKLLQYEMRGEIPLARGGIIFCEDGSSSMQGEQELWAKGVMLCLLHLARKQRRSFHLVHFGSPRQFQTISFENPQDYELDKIIDAAELFFNGGTDFETPMAESLRILKDQFGRMGHVKSDVVFCTDDECRVSEGFMKHYLAESERLQFTTYGIAITQGRVDPNGALAEMSQGKVVQVKDLLSGEDVREIFRQL